MRAGQKRGVGGRYIGGEGKGEGGRLWEGGSRETGGGGGAQRDGGRAVEGRGWVEILEGRSGDECREILEGCGGWAGVGGERGT